MRGKERFIDTPMVTGMLQFHDLAQLLTGLVGVTACDTNLLF